MILNEKLSKWTLIITLLSSAIGASTWLFNVQNQAELNKNDIIKLTLDLKESSDKIEDVNIRLHRIEEKINYLILLLKEK